MIAPEPAASFADKHLLLVGTGGVKRRRVLAALRGLGLRRITCLNDGPNWAADFVDDWIEADPVRPSPATLELVLQRIGRPDGVFTYDEYSVVATAHLAEGLGLIGTRPEAAARAKDKAAFRRFCRERGLPAPRFVRLDANAADPVALLVDAGIAFPVVVKPTHGAGSVFVRRADDAATFARTLREYRRDVVVDPVSGLWPDRSVLVEEYLPGDEVDIDLLLQGGEVRHAAVTDNFAPVEPYFLELAGQIPSALPGDAQRELVDVAAQVTRELGVSDGCVHFEARWTARGAIPIEANLRIGGAEVYEFNRGAHGVDLVEAAVRIALGMPVPATAPAAPSGPPGPRTYLRSAAFNPPLGGTLEAVEVDPVVERDPFLGELVVFRHVGDPIRVPPDGFDYLGWIVVRGADRAAADRNLARLAPGVRFRVAGQWFTGAFLGPRGSERASDSRPPISRP